MLYRLRFVSRPAAAVGVFALRTATRGVQFEQTSEALRGVNKGRRATAAPWVTKSTKDYMSEADSKSRGASSLASQRREEMKENSLKRRERFKTISEETDRIFDLEMDRIREDTNKRWKKGWDFFKRQGKAFTILYVSTYVGMLMLLYAGFASGFLKKEAALEVVLFFLQSYIDRDKFYARIAAWSTYVDFGFAFVLNEMLEVARFPFVMFTFYQFRPYLTGVNARVKASIFSRRAAKS